MLVSSSPSRAADAAVVRLPQWLVQRGAAAQRCTQAISILTAITLGAAAMRAGAQVRAAAQQNSNASTAGEQAQAPLSPDVVEGVTVEPALVELSAGESKQFRAVVTGTGNFSSAVKWAAGGVEGGNATLGTITGAGLYVTPYPAPASVTITATSTAAPSKSSTAVVKLVATPPAAGPALTVNAGKATHPISPLIYGMNAWRLTDPHHQAPLVAEATRLPLDRWGGEGVTRYNYKLDISSAGEDWFFELVPNRNSKYPDQSQFNSQVEQDRATGAKTLATVPVMGWVAKTRTHAASFSVAKYGPQQKTDPYWHDFGNGVRPDGTEIVNNDPNDTSMPVDAAWTADWVKYLVGRFGDAAHGGVAIYSLDNEPTWWNKIHRDVHPLPFTYEEVTENGLKVAQAVKAADPTAEVSGPVIDSWMSFFYSSKDLDSMKGHWMDPARAVDRRAHGNVPLIEYYLQAFKAAQDADPQHTRLLDYLDLHTYFAAKDAGLKPAGNSQQQKAVLNSTRVFWDPSYTDFRFRNPDNIMATMPPELIPRMMRWVAADYPGTKTAITEYNWGGAEHISGAVAESDILGIFGREGLDMAALWGPPNLDQPLLYAFKMFRNYDGKGGQFGDLSLAATSGDQGRLSIYAARRTADGRVTVMVINKTFGDLKAALTLENFKARGRAKVFQYSAADLGRIQQLPKAKVARGQLERVFPAMSITMVEIRGS